MDAHELRNTVRRRLGGRRLVVVSNRQPFIHQRRGDDIICTRPASGLTTALDPILRATHGLWVAHGNGSADAEVVDVANRVKVPPDRPLYTLKRVWLTAQQEADFYYGFSNQALWPLCHVAYQFPLFERKHWDAYREVNAIFADAVAEEIGREPAFVFIQDYHFALLSGMIKERCPRAITAQFWHIPWPNAEVFRICPWKREILEGLLNNDIVGFHLRYHCLNFLESVSRCLEARVDSERLAVAYQGVTTKVRAFPISVDAEEVARITWTPEVDRETLALRDRFNLSAKYLAVGVDRLDYTKGISERFHAIDRFLDKYPQYRGQFVFLQVGAPTRMSIASYQEAERGMVAVCDAVNRKHGTSTWQPIIFVREHVEPASLFALYRMANACIVSSLHDGMNLVAKEFVSARADERGVLLLSRFTGAARELTDAVLINPYATDEFAEQIRDSLEMPEDEMRRRMRSMRRVVNRNNIYRWGSDIIEKLARLEEPEDAEAEAVARRAAGD